MRFDLLLAIISLSLPVRSARAQWELQDAHVIADLRGIDYVGGGVAWASGSHGTVLRTEDMGSVWQLCATPQDAKELDFRGVQAFDNKKAIVMSSGPGEKSRLYKTMDGCQTWKLVFTNPDKDGFWDAVKFERPIYNTLSKEWTKPTYGLLLGDPINGEFVRFATHDAGDTWERLTAHKHDRNHDCGMGAFGALPSESLFAASNEALALHDGLSSPVGSVFVTGGSSPRLVYDFQTDELDGLLCHSSAKFVKLSIPGSASAGAFAVAFKKRKRASGVNQPPDISQWMVVGGDYRQPDATAGTAVWVTALPLQGNMGLSFLLRTRKAKVPPHGYRSAVAYVESAKAWITVGPNGTDVSTDDGRNWRPLKPGLGDVPDADRNWNALSLPFVVGPKGRIGILREAALGGAPEILYTKHAKSTK